MPDGDPTIFTHCNCGGVCQRTRVKSVQPSADVCLRTGYQAPPQPSYVCHKCAETHPHPPSPSEGLIFLAYTNYYDNSTCRIARNLIQSWMLRRQRQLQQQ